MESWQLLLSVVEALKLPLLQIGRLSEAGNSAQKIQTTADNALRLLDNYLLGMTLSAQPHHLELETVSISSVLYDTGQQLDALAKNYGVELELNIAGRYGPVRAHRAGLQAALVSLGAALIEALPAQESSQLKLQLATHRCRYGIVAGLYAEAPRLTSEALRRGRALRGHSRQALPNLSHSNGAGIFVADTILSAMDLRLQASRHRHLHGLGAVLQPNHQMQLV